MYRYKIKELIDWKISEYRKPLIILGARQVGKTWLIEEFGRQEYKTTYKSAKAIRTSLADYKEETWMTNVPLYAMGDYFSEL